MFNNANWIWTNEKYDENESVICYFRKSFYIDKDIKNAELKISADTHYRLYINEENVCAGPKKGDNEIWYYEKIDLKNYLKKGENLFAIMVLKYPLSPYKGNRAMFRTNYPGLVAEIKLDDEYIVTDNSWKCKINENYKIGCHSSNYNRLYNEEEVFGNEINNFMNFDYNDTDWLEPYVYKDGQFIPSKSPKTLQERKTPLMFEKRERFTNVFNIIETSLSKSDYDNLIFNDKSIVIEKNKKEIIDLYVDKYATAYYEIDVEKGAEATITFIASESYAIPKNIENRIVYVRNDRFDYKNGSLYGTKDIYHVKGYGSEKKYEHYEPLLFKSFRFVRIEIETKNQPIIIHKLQLRRTNYPLEIKAKIETDDEFLNKIWEISLNTLKNCMHDTYEDCPHYEQLQYLMDTRSQALFTYVVANDNRLAKQAIDDFGRGQRSNGLIPSSYPTVKETIIPSFSFYYIGMIYDYMMYYGDKEFIKVYYPNLEKIILFFQAQLDDKYLMRQIENSGSVDKQYWAYIDCTGYWKMGLPPIDSDDVNIPLTLMFANCLLKMIEISNYLNYYSQVGIYENLYKKIKKAIKTYALKDGVIVDSLKGKTISQFCQVYGVLSRILNKKEGQFALKKSFELDFENQVSLPTTLYLLKALKKVGLYEYTQKVYDRFRKMIACNLNTCLEHDSKDMHRSDCHGWSSVMLYEIISTIIGIIPTRPGFEEFEFNPHDAGISYIKGTIATNKGLIVASWKKENNEIKKDINYPKAMKLKGE